MTSRLFLALRYDALADEVRVTVRDLPHAPWSFGEKIVTAERVMHLADTEQAGTAVIEIAGTAAHLVCSSDVGSQLD